MSRLNILKTYKLFIGGKFPRTESGRHYSPKNSNNEVLCNACLSSKKDVKNAVVAARKALDGWSSKTAFNRSQILYRIAEVLEGRKAQFIEEMMSSGTSMDDAKKEVETSIDVLVYYAGWCDKYNQVASSVNSVSSSHFNFSIYSEVGVVGLLFNTKSALLDLVHSVASTICGGNTVVVLVNHLTPMSAITFGEVVNTSDVPGGVINILTGDSEELIDVFSTHMDIDSICLVGFESRLIKRVEENACSNLKRTISYSEDENQISGIDKIIDFQELKTTWHPIEDIGGASSTY